MTGRASAWSGAPTGRLARPLHEVEGVDAGAELLAHDQVAERVVLRGEALGLRRRPRRRDQVERTVRRGCGPVQLRVGDRAASGHGCFPGLLVTVDLRAYDGDLAAKHLGRPPQRLLQEVRAVEDRVRDAELGDLRTLQHTVLVERVLDDHRDGFVRTDQVGQQPAAAPAGHQPEERLRQRNTRDGRMHGAVRAVECDLEPTAEREPVDEGERRHRAVAEPGEDPVAHPADLEGLLALGDQRHALEVRAGREDERLAGEADRDDPGLRVCRVECPVQLEQAGRAQCVRFGVVVPVVECDQRGLAGFERQLDEPDEGLGDDLVGERGDGIGAGHQAAASSA